MDLAVRRTSEGDEHRERCGSEDVDALSRLAVLFDVGQDAAQGKLGRLEGRGGGDDVKVRCALASGRNAIEPAAGKSRRHFVHVNCSRHRKNENGIAVGFATCCHLEAEPLIPRICWPGPRLR